MEMRVHRDLMMLHFKPASQGADLASPPLGHCAWLDRGFRPGEPTTLLWWTGGGVEVTTLLGRSTALYQPPPDPPRIRTKLEQAAEGKADRRDKMTLELYNSTRRQAALTRALAQAAESLEARRRREKTLRRSPPDWVDRLEFEGDDPRKTAAYSYLYRAAERGQLFYVAAYQTDQCRVRGMPRCLFVARVGP
jgi:hypothetical protein